MDLKNYKNLDSTKKTLMSLGIFLAITSLSYFLIISPSLDNIENDKIQIMEKKSLAQSRFAQDATTNSILKDIRDNEKKIETLSSIYVNENRELEMITRLESLADGHSIKQQVSISRENTTNPNFQKIILQIKSSGELKELMAYLTEVERMNYYFNIPSIDLAVEYGAERTNGALTFSAELYLSKLVW